MKNYQEALKLNKKYAKLETIRKYASDEVFSIIEKIWNRKVERVKEVKSVKQFCINLIKERLERIAKELPDEGYSMGSYVVVRFNMVKGFDDRTSTYSSNCTWKETYGHVEINLSLKELINTRIINGVVTYLYPNQKQNIKKCYWYSSEGRKQHFELTKVEGYAGNGYHNESKQKVKERIIMIKNHKRKERTAKANFNKALRLQYSFLDSLVSGNCEAGSLNFIRKANLEKNLLYRGKYLLKKAERLDYGISGIKIMIKRKAINL